jgi:hypothetical protein
MKCRRKRNIDRIGKSSVDVSFFRGKAGFYEGTIMVP